MSVEWNRFWCRVLFKEFIKHFRKMNDEQIVRDVRQSMDDLEDLVPDTDSFGSQMVRWSLERADEPFATAARENGKKGGRPKKINGDASTREGEGAVICRESGFAELTTVSEDMGRVPQNGTHPRIQGGDRAAQGAMSPSPSGAAQDGKTSTTYKDKRKQGESNTGSVQPVTRPESGNIYDQEPTQISTDEARQSQRRAGADSLRGTPLHSAPARSSGTMPDDVQLVYDFAAAENLDPVDAYECWNVTVNERDVKTADGKRITNWKAYVRKWCVTRASKRRTA